MGANITKFKINKQHVLHLKYNMLIVKCLKLQSNGSELLKLKMSLQRGQSEEVHEAVLELKDDSKNWTLQSTKLVNP